MRLNKMRMIFAIFFGMLLGNSAMLFAAEDAPAEIPAADTSEDQTAEEMLAAEAALEAQEAQANGSTDNPDGAGENPIGSTSPADFPPGATSPTDEDFVPTIQISEDLSVSFPVDI